MNAAPCLLFVAPSAYPLGGVQTWLDYLLPGLAERKWRPVLGLVAGRFHDVERYLTVHPWPETVAIANPTGSAVGRIRALCRVIERIQPDLVVSVNIPDCYAAVERLRLRRRTSPRVVMTNHSVEAQYLGDAKAWRDVLDGMIGTNHLTCRLAVEWAGLAPERVHYAPYGVELPPRPDRQAIDRAAGPSTDRSTVRATDRVTDRSAHLTMNPVTDPATENPAESRPLRIAYSGRLDEEQKRASDIPLILEALDALGVDYELRLAGGGPSEAGLRERLRPRVVAGQVSFLGVLAPAALNEQLYDWADVLLVTSSWETGPIVIWEAMARGLPVVTSRYIGSGLENSLLDGDNCLMYQVGDTRAAATQLQRMTETSQCATLAQRGRALVADRYTRPLSVAQWDACLRAILDQPQQPSSRTPRSVPPAGRLDRWLGTGLGEHVRRLSGRAHRHSDAGGEWPHVSWRNCTDASAEKTLWELAGRIDSARIALDY